MPRLGSLVSLVLTGLLLAPPGVRADTPWRFIAVGDSRGDNNGVNTVILAELVTQIVGQQPDLVLFSGDLVTGSSDTNTLISQLTTWRTTMQPVYSAGIRVLAVRGNHENLGSVAAWNAVFSGAYAMPANGPSGEINITFSLAHRNALVAGLDEYSTHIHRVNQSWLDSQFAANTLPHVFVFGHEPAFKVYHADCLDDYPSNRDAFWRSIADAGGRTYFCGHDHLYDRARIHDPNGTPDTDLQQLVVATAGAPLYVFDGNYNGANSYFVPVQQHDASQYGYVVGDVDGLQVTLTWMQRAAAGSYVPMDSWTYLAVPAALLGDVNCDGVVNLDDVDPFVLMLSGPAAWQAMYPGCYYLNGDCDHDGDVDFDDIDPFVAILTGLGGSIAGP